ncbi:hypothetical protein TWF694_010225 [Orbilia ellipsospora]|uniref:Uncharacterized protein n=1 Tax=Orbilia ellipsospora TaxID=2528407 RepID=A0AAV9XAE9_9PEZI
MLFPKPISFRRIFWPCSLVLFVFSCLASEISSLFELGLQDHYYLTGPYLYEPTIPAILPQFPVPVAPAAYQTTLLYSVLQPTISGSLEPSAQPGSLVFLAATYIQNEKEKMVTATYFTLNRSPNDLPFPAIYNSKQIVLPAAVSIQGPTKVCSEYGDWALFPKRLESFLLENSLFSENRSGQNTDLLLRGTFDIIPQNRNEDENDDDDDDDDDDKHVATRICTDLIHISKGGSGDIKGDRSLLLLMTVFYAMIIKFVSTTQKRKGVRALAALMGCIFTVYGYRVLCEAAKAVAAIHKLNSIHGNTYPLPDVKTT